MVRFFFGAAPDLADAPRMLRSSLLRASICSLIAAARLSWLTVRSSKFMASVNIQSWWKSSTGQTPTMPSLKVCTLVIIVDGGAGSIPRWFFWFFTCQSRPTSTYMAFSPARAGSTEIKSAKQVIHTSGRIVNKSRPGPNY